MSVQSYIQAIRSASRAGNKAWETSLTDLTGKGEKDVTDYFDKATKLLTDAKVAKDDPDRVMVRNHKSLLLGLLKRGGTIKPGLGKSKVQNENRDARKGEKDAKGEKEKADDGQNPENGIINAVAYLVKHWQAVPPARLLTLLAPLHDLIARTYQTRKAA